MINSTLPDDRRPVNGHAPRVERLSLSETPPHDADAELGLLAAEIYRPGSFARLGVVRSDFYTGTGREVFDALEAMRLAGAPISFETLRHFLRMLPDEGGMGPWEMIGGEGTLAAIESCVSAADHAGYYFDIVKAAAVRRAIKERALAIAGAAQHGDLDTLLERADFADLRPSTQAAPFNFLDADELLAGEFEQTYYIENILAEGQPGGIYGSFKTLKTSLVVAMGFAIASGAPFLDLFRVLQSVPFALMSGESGLPVLRDTACRVCASKGWALDQLKGRFFISSELPQLANLTAMRALGQWIREREVKVLAIDPAYMFLDVADGAGNLFAMGKVLRVVAEACREWGCTLLILHHNKRGPNVGPDRFQPAQLSDIAWSGFAEFSAQWLMLSRRSEYDAETGDHRLWLNVGGRAGHGGLYGVDVLEGRCNDPGGRIWQVEVHLASETRAGAAADQAKRQEEARERKQSLTAQKDREAVLKSLRRFQAGETARSVRDASRLSGSRFTPIIVELEDLGIVEGCNVVKSKGTYEGYKITAGWWDKVGQSQHSRHRMKMVGHGTLIRESQSHPIIMHPGALAHRQPELSHHPPKTGTTSDERHHSGTLRA